MTETWQALLLFRSFVLWIFFGFPLLLGVFAFVFLDDQSVDEREGAGDVPGEPRVGAFEPHGEAEEFRDVKDGHVECALPPPADGGPGSRRG